MAYSFKQRKDGGFDFFDASGKKTNIESYTKNTGANINQLRQKLATQGDTQSQRIVAGLPTQFRAPTQQSTPSVFNTPVVRTPTMPQSVSQPTIQAPKVYTPKAQQAYTDAKIIGTGRPNDVRQAITRTVDRKNSVRLDPQFKQGKSYEDIAKDGGFSIDEVKRYAERNHKGYGDQGVVGNAARATGQFIGGMFDRGAGIVTRPFNDASDLNRNKGEAELQQINKDYRSGNITPAAAMERANALAGRYTTQKASLHDDGFIHIGVQSLPEFGGNFTQQGIDSASLLPVGGGVASGSARIASAVGNKTAANTLNKAASIMTAGAQTQATSKLANALTARGMNPQTANLVGNAVTSNAKQSLVYGSAQTGADVASGRGITPESLAMNYGADFLMGAVPEIGLGSVGRGIDLNNTKVHQELVRTNPTYKANTDKLTGIDATIARAQANGDVRALEGLQAVKAQLSDSNALIAKRYSENGFLGGKNATGFKDAEARAVADRMNMPMSERYVKPEGQTLYHGGAGVGDMRKNGVKILSPEEKMKYASSGGGYVGLSTSADKAYAQQFSEAVAGNSDVLELQLKPDARVLELADGQMIDNMSANELSQLSKDYDVIKSLEDNEYRILNDSALAKLMDEDNNTRYSLNNNYKDTPATIQELNKRSLQLHGDRNVSINSALTDGKGNTAHGMYTYADDMIKIADGRGINTMNHESVHRAFKNHLTPDERTLILDEIKKTYKEADLRGEYEKMGYYKRTTNQLAEEQLANNFIKYAEARANGIKVSVAGIDLNIPRKVVALYERVYTKIKETFGNPDYVQQFYARLESGKYSKPASKDVTVGSPARGTAYSIDPNTPKVEAPQAKDSLDSILNYYKENPRSLNLDSVRAEYVGNKTALARIDKAVADHRAESKANSIAAKKQAELESTATPKFISGETYGEPKKYKIAHEGGSFEAVDGQSVKIADGIDAFIHKNNGGYVVSEASTGRAISGARSMDGAVREARDLIDQMGGADKVRAIINGDKTPKQPTAFESDLKKAGLGVEPDAYRKQPQDIKKAIDTHIASENPQLAYALDSKLHFPDGIPKVRPEDVRAITGLSTREAGIPTKYVSRNAPPIDKLTVDYETTVRGNVDGELKMTGEDFLDTMMDAIEADRSVGKQTKLIRELRNNPDVIAKAKATLEAERAQYGAPEVAQPSKSDVAFLNRADKQRIEQDVTTHKAKLQEINKKIREEKPKNPVLPTYKTKQVGIIDKVFRSTRSIIERQGEPGKKLAEALQDQRTNKELWIRQIEKQIPTVMKLKGKEFENFIDATQGDARPLNDNVSKAIGEWRSTHPEVRQRGLDAGLNIGDLGETYYPHFIDYDKIYKDKNTYNEAINHLVTTKQAETPEAAIALLGRARDISRNREFGNLEASRIIDLPFYDRSKNTLASYINSSADRITKAEVFGKSDEKALALIKQIGLEGGDTEAAKNAFDVAVGAKQYNHTASKVSGGIRQYITTTRLGLGALTNISQNVNTGVVTGHLRTMGAIFKQLDPKTRQWAADTGVISDAIINDLRRGYGAETFGNKKLGRVVNAITAPGFATVEKFNRRVAATAGKDYALRLAQKGDAKSISTLRKLGVEGEINGTLTDAQQVQAARKIVEKTQFKVDAQDLPGWTDSPGGKLVSQFRTFSYSQAKFFSNEVLKPAAKGNLMPLARVLAALPVGYALYETRRMIDGRPEEEDKSKVALSSFQKIGGAGLALDIYLGMNPVGSKYLPSDRRVSMAVGTLGGPSAGIAADAVGSLSEAVQRKNTPEDESRLDGKIAVANNGEDYTDLTALSRFGLRQIPIVGTPIVNRAIPYKKQSDADAGKSTTGNAGLDELAKAKEKRSADLKNAFSKEDWKLYSLSKADRQKLVSNGTYSQEKIDGLMKYGKAKEAELGYGATSTDITAKTPTSAKSIIETYDTLDTEARKKWNTEKNTNAAVTKGLQSWLGDKVKIPEVTNDVAKEWADFQNDYAAGKVSKLKENDQKKAILKKAFNSQLSTDEKEIHTLTKAELQYYYDNGVITDENINKAIAVEKQLFDAGLIAKETLQRNLGSSARGYKTSSGSSGRKTSTKTASKASIADILASQKQINDINNSTYLSLSKLLGSVSSGSSKMAKNKIGREVTLKKITGAKA